MSGQETNQTRPTQLSRHTKFRETVEGPEERQCNDGGEIVAYQQTIFVKTINDPSLHEGVNALNKTGGATFDKPIAGYVRSLENGGNVTAISRVAYVGTSQANMNDGQQQPQNTGTLEGLLGRGERSST